MTKYELIQKFTFYIVVSVCLYFLSFYLNSTFLIKFNNDFINLITTIFAINVASTSIVYSKLKEINEKTGIEFTDARKELSAGFKNQIVLIGLSFIIQIIINSHLTKVYYIDLVLNSMSIVIFIYFLEVTYDLGKSIIELFTSNEL